MVYSDEWFSVTRGVGLVSTMVALLACIAAGTKKADRSQRFGGLRNLFSALSGVQLTLFLDMVFDWRWKIHALGMQEALVLGDYGVRRYPQFLALVLLVGIGTLGLVFVVLRLRGNAGAAIALSGSSLWVGLWLAEVISYHYLDQVLYRKVAGMMVISFLWMFLALLVVFGTWKYSRPSGYVG